jgi:hypothetical protein
MKSREEIIEQLQLADDNPQYCSGMSYVDGVKYALEWVIEDIEDKPMEDEL